MVKTREEDEESEENVKFLYKLSEGPCPKSYGFNAARLAGMPTHVTKRAIEIAKKLEAEVKLRRAFTAICKETNRKSLKNLLKKVVTNLSK